MSDLARIPVVILAGGRGTRISEETGVRPKPMVEIGGMPILWHIMKIYAAHGLTDFIICLGYKGAMISQWFLDRVRHSGDFTIDLASGAIDQHSHNAEPWRVTLADTGEDTQTGGRLRRIVRYLPESGPFCATYGDGVSDVDIAALLAFHRAHGAQATVTAVVPPARFGMLGREGARVTNFAEKPVDPVPSMNGGFFVFDRMVIDRIKGDDTVLEREPLEGLAADGELMAFEHRGFWQPMDTLREKIELETLWNGGRAPWKVW